MITAKAFSKQLDTAIPAQLGKPKPVSFRLHFRQTSILSTNSIPQLLNHGELLLGWEDDTISLHEISSDWTQMPHLPLDEWRKLRFFGKMSRIDSALENDQFPSVPRFDPKIEHIFLTGEKPDWLDQYQYRLVLTKEKLIQSNGIDSETNQTEAVLRLPGYWFDYRSSFLPADDELRYLQMEQTWFHQMTKKRMPVNSSIQPKSQYVVLFGPDSFRTILRHCEPYLQESSPVRFHEWLLKQEEVLIIPKIFADSVSSKGTEWLIWAPTAYIYQAGTFTGITSTRFRLKAASLFTSFPPQLVSKIGWDGYGAAFSSGSLVHTS